MSSIIDLPKPRDVAYAAQAIIYLMIKDGEIGPDFNPGEGLDDVTCYRWSVTTDNYGKIITSWIVKILDETHICGRDVDHEIVPTILGRNYVQVIEQSNKLTKDELFENSSYLRLLDACKEAVKLHPNDFLYALVEAFLILKPKINPLYLSAYLMRISRQRILSTFLKSEMKITKFGDFTNTLRVICEVSARFPDQSTQLVLNITKHRYSFFNGSWVEDDTCRFLVSVLNKCIKSEKPIYNERLKKVFDHLWTWRAINRGKFNL